MPVFGLRVVFSAVVFA